MSLPIPDKKRKRASWFSPVHRGYIKTKQSIIRYLSVCRYDESGNERQFVCRLAANDPRARGLNFSPSFEDDKCRQRDIDYYMRFPIGQWVEIVYADPAPAPKAAPQLLLMEHSSCTGGES